MMQLSKESILKPRIGPKIGLFYQMASHVVNAKEKLFSFILIFWSIAALQCCVMFCCTAKWISYTYTICCCLVAKSGRTLCDPMNCSPPSSSVHGILQARILVRVASAFSRGSSWPRDWTCVSCIAGGVYTEVSHQGSLYVYLYIYPLFLRFYSHNRSLQSIE